MVKNFMNKMNINPIYGTEYFEYNELNFMIISYFMSSYKF